ncbi:2,3-bisphosphoglycerate-independentphosphoglycerate mutase [Clathrus columnatus]|uniref:2, 3-bisphosphoglycerate-independentphosphoglycerate mutase n=1 Tax=Clathrus columnatus TaxID=1419009 RepID=A0AAV5A6Z8_9AGAM|nr:2,3-bisphosphoglycerate-independentphosphoglycerate mutase [Clathrus columnatus]
MDTISKNHAFRQLAAHGLAVGLSDGLMGNSEVGHLNIGAGRVVWQDIVRIDQGIKKRTFHKEKAIVAACERAKNGNGRLHLLGLEEILLQEVQPFMLNSCWNLLNRRE